ncbi:MAG: hypothetical protein K0S07_440 [Chlamydiales bacterium]|jgi:hypothetical protein|nr:hypothetical protein [Chlamydiales bacterium]
MLNKKFSPRIFSGLILFSLAATPLMSLQAATATSYAREDQKPKGSEAAINDKVTFEGAFHHLSKIAVADHSVVFEDGSTWSVKESDCKNLESWNEGDKVIITQSTETFGSLRYKYKLVNLDSNNNVAAVNLQHPPSKQDEMRCISNIDKAKNELSLSDDSLWKVTSADASTLNFMTKNSRIVVGVNADEDNNEFPYILIDCDRNLYVRVTEG